ncbi:DUF1837 domain-containing protein [Siphonobacter sp. SORGH_AS_0500]|uniref:HamA C-terminal domain-containing protein n=1 Tax=Siphonobacter sp. SORGH_AS_0500 TaxID=1864824 RepID=UPI00286C5784|nr:DUF1837 domain-containing protein [Siphonobacter sp. SORGH_AS_0500]
MQISNNVCFDVLIDDFFTNINIDAKLTPISKKKVLSLINGWEEGLWRYKDFQNFIWDNIAETALSSRERESLINQSLLLAAAKNLRFIDKNAKIGQASELAEVLLYGIMKHHYGALPVVPKIYYKQNNSDNAKGADSVHIVIDNSNDFSIWLGEAKFYNDIQDSRLYDIVNSVSDSVNADKLKKENYIISRVKDLDDLVKDTNMRKSILDILDQKTSIDLYKAKLHIPILLLHECSITNKTSLMTQNYKDEIIAYHKDRANSYFKKQVNKMSKSVHLYSEISFHIILFPVPEKDKIIEKFNRNLEFYKNN